MSSLRKASVSLLLKQSLHNLLLIGASSKGCPLYQNHVLTSNECKMKNGFGIGTPQECLYTSKYTAPGGRKPTYTNQYIRNRDGSTVSTD